MVIGPQNRVMDTWAVAVGFLFLETWSMEFELGSFERASVCHAPWEVREVRVWELIVYLGKHRKHGTDGTPIITALLECIRSRP
ncbi:hypothetical protein PanWU01x14_327960 [Parasponia andersonii]|uniref:Uncharacterized protein n=1 Tax=Parasponia andersonii TaxID=3476 RepID=A0A2P5AIY8_PARAD|nr:hypothetical protein PanWU01x14_327960 [Parasponia andersonii]